MKNKRSASRRTPGFSVPEVLAALAIAGVLVAVAMPSAGRLVQDSRRAALVNELLATLVLARAEAIKRTQVVVVCGFDDTNRNGRLDETERRCRGQDWSHGWFSAAWVDADGDNTVDPPELAMPLLTVRANDVRSLSVTAPMFTAGALPAGTAVLRPLSRHSSNGSFAICDGRGADHGRAIVVSPTGRSRSALRRPDGGPVSCPVR